jgi:phage terminase large subunit-like protein
MYEKASGSAELRNKEIFHSVRFPAASVQRRKAEELTVSLVSTTPSPENENEDMSVGLTVYSDRFSNSSGDRVTVNEPVTLYCEQGGVYVPTHDVKGLPV